MSALFTWANICRDISHWTRNCMDCQKYEAHKRTCVLLGTFSSSDARFQHIHTTFAYKSEQHVFTNLYRQFFFSGWPEVIPLTYTFSLTVAQTLVTKWISRFRMRVKIATNCGRKFESKFFPQSYIKC